MVQFADNLESVITEATQGQGHPLWRPRIVHVRADITGLDDATIYFGLLKSEPLANFELLLAQDCPALDAWLAPFGALRIDQIFFLYAWSSVPHGSYKVTQLAGLSLGIATPGDNYTRWLTTFPQLRQGKLVAWCVEIDMRYQGGNAGVMEIVLSEGNMLLLER
ncbi:MAG TPA: hypothetical protein VNG51_19005 [Ktedonobacteraceae bacterium]|nr:hypothetical protein [Ktedonobacteraceae bacterium]